MKSPQNKQFVTVKLSDFRSHMLHRFWYELRLQKSIILTWKINQDNMIRVRNKEKKYIQTSFLVVIPLAGTCQ